MPHKADTTVICQCGAMVCKYYMPKHLRTVKHESDMVIRMCVCVYVCMYVCVYVRVSMYVLCMYVIMYVCMYIPMYTQIYITSLARLFRPLLERAR